MIVAGIDPSLSRTAVCIGGHSDAEQEFDMAAFTSKGQGPGVRERMRRFEDLTAKICDHLEAGNQPPQLILIEGYAYGSEYATAALCEFGGILRYNLVDVVGPEGRILEVAPGTLKKFITGKGNSPKDQMGAHVAKRWGHVFAHNDAVDAFSLWQLARCCVDESLCDWGYQVECVRKVLGHVDIEEAQAEEDQRIAALLAK
jgi:crossover junction endodeoxyribonuclease RuvC